MVRTLKNMATKTSQVLLLVFASLLSSFAIAKTDIVFVVDGSGSIDANDFALQKTGIANALNDRLTFPVDSTVAVSIVQFSGSETEIELPYTVLSSESSVSNAIYAIQNITQLGSLTNPGDGINTASQIFTANARNDALQSICLSTDGTRNSGAPVATAIADAKAAPYQLDSFSVLAIPDGGFGANEANTEYGAHVFGGGQVFVVSNTVEFANVIGQICISNDKKLVGLEVTQAVQDLENSVILVEDKKTVVRVYLESTTSEITTASARLIGKRGGNALPGSPLTANYKSAPSIAAGQDAIAQRGDISKSLNFELPESWVDGAVEFEVEAVGGNLICEETAGPTANDCKASVNFVSGRDLDVKFVRLGFKDKNGVSHLPSTKDAKELRKRLLATYPVANVSASYGLITLPDVNEGVEVIDVLTRLIKLKRSEGCGDSCNTQYYAFTNETAPYFGYWDNGTWQAIGGIANGVPSATKVSLGQKIDSINSYGYNRHGHEIGHALGRHHAVAGCGSVADTGAPIFPNINQVDGRSVGTIGPLSPEKDVIFGFDSYLGRIIDPEQNFAMMSYCRPAGQMRWVSDYTYEGLHATLNTPPRHAKIAIPAAGPILNTYYILTGGIDLVNNVAEFSPVSQVESSDAPIIFAGLTDYTLELQKADGTVLYNVPVEVNELMGDPLVGGNNAVNLGGATFSIKAPKLALTQKAVLKNNGLVIGQLVASANAPVANVTYPNGGEVLTAGDITITWDATDADGGTLYSTVQYSADNGANWQTLALDIEQKTLVVNTSNFVASTTALIRVLVSDGFNITTDDSNAVFETPNNPPEVEILSPVTNSSFGSVQAVAFRADVTDAEDGNLPAGDIVWSSNIDGLLGTGDSIDILASNLAEGVHTITLTAVDDDGGTSSADVLINIVRVIGANGVFAAGPTPVSALVVTTPKTKEDGYIIIDGVDSSGVGLTYRWVQLSGVDTRITNQLSAKLIAQTPNVDKDEVVTYQLTITDVFGVTDRIMVTVTILNTDNSSTTDENTTTTVVVTTEGGSSGSSVGIFAFLLLISVYIRRIIK